MQKVRDIPDIAFEILQQAFEPLVAVRISRLERDRAEDISLIGM